MLLDSILEVMNNFFSPFFVGNGNITIDFGGSRSADAELFGNIPLSLPIQSGVQFSLPMPGCLCDIYIPCQSSLQSLISLKKLLCETPVVSFLSSLFYA